MNYFTRKRLTDTLIRFIPAFFLLVAYPADAAVSLTIDNPLQFSTFCGLIKAIASAIFWISIPVGILVIVYAGFLFMTSNGSPEKIKAGKEALFFAILGMAVGMSAQGIVYVVYSFFGLSGATCS